MAKLTKFPLEMANGAKVRSIEELRENADVKSIVAYFLDGRLRRWCNAWRYDDLPEKLENVTCEMIKNIYDVLEIPVDVQEIEAYVKENSTHMSSQPMSCAEVEEPLTDNEKVKNKLKSYIDASISLSDYSIEVTPVEAEDGKICKYKVSIANEKTEQYVSFVLPYDVKGGYTKSRFEYVLCKTIENAMKKQRDVLLYNAIKTSRYAELSVGDIFEFGIFEGKPITWIVLDKKPDKLLVQSETALCKRCFGGNFWTNSKIRSWLNCEFYSSSFHTDEKDFIASSERTNIHGKGLVCSFSSKCSVDGMEIMNIDGIPCKVKAAEVSIRKTKDNIFLLSLFELQHYSCIIEKTIPREEDEYCCRYRWTSSVRPEDNCGVSTYYNFKCRNFSFSFMDDHYENDIYPAFWLKY